MEGRKMDGRKGEGWRMVSGSEEGVMGAHRRSCVVVLGPGRHLRW